MKKLFAFVVLLSLTFAATLVHAQQAFEQGRTIGSFGIGLQSGSTPLLAGFEYGASDAFGVGARIMFVPGRSGYYSYSRSITALQAFGNFHMAEAFNVSGDKFDPFIGAGLGKVFVEGSPFFFDLQAGARYLVNERVGPYAQLNVGVINDSGATFELGVSYKFGR